ncbi:MAG: hypothetical protein QOF02_1634 [Blastocatellia bacterium]|jgi:hypothetical protein|nr:hypothetical protein [Blastocatellia bacterium]
MRRLAFLTLMLLTFSQMVVAQSSADACHVYLIDNELAQKAMETYDKATTEQEREKASANGWVRILGEFSPQVGEEELTTRSFNLPGSKSVITASVFYTDEMMPSATGANSMLLGIVIADKPQANALFAPHNAVAEVTYNQYTDTVRVKTTIKIGGRDFLVGLQCQHQTSPAKK